MHKTGSVAQAIHDDEKVLSFAVNHIQDVILISSIVFSTSIVSEKPNTPYIPLHTGVWEATQGETRSIKGETFEFCHIISGVVEITPDGGAPLTFRAGDSFVMKPGFTGVWNTVETVRKIYVTVS